LIFVTGRGKSAIEDHFDISYELEHTLELRGKRAELDMVRSALLKPGSVIYTRQQEPLGLGHAVWCARNVAGGEPVAVLLADDLIRARTPCLKQMVEVYNEVGGNLVAVMDVPREHTGRYGVLKTGRQRGRLVEVEGLVEKPKPAEAPSTLSIIGRYILQPEVFEILGRLDRGAGNEIQLTDAMAAMIGRGPFHGYRFEGTRYDCGDKAGFVEATLAFGLDHPQIGGQVRALLSRLAAPVEGG
ncbi:MAG: UTP--glucose-1-phosphate uridylyltransferase, partial [Rhodospirillaceae bacterium]|nr:UTP--glucose-1-phosphate uridylyltransferase [Rhodospirillaceae bacterium]